MGAKYKYGVEVAIILLAALFAHHLAGSKQCEKACSGYVDYAYVLGGKYESSKCYCYIDSDNRIEWPEHNIFSFPVINTDYKQENATKPDKPEESGSESSGFAQWQD